VDFVRERLRQLQGNIQRNGSVADNVWLAMAVCWSGNTELYGKRQFPYTYAANLSVRLWRRKTKHRVLVSIVHTAEDVDDESMLAYGRGLETITPFAEPGDDAGPGDGGVVVEYVLAEDMDCPLKAQVHRMLTWQNARILDDDIVVTTDVDAFPVDPHIFDALSSQHLIWIFQYSHTAKTYASIPMTFVAMRKMTWKLATRVDSAEALVAKYEEELKLDKVSVWDWDQQLLSRIILENELCSFDKRNTIWRSVKLEARPFDDSSTCFHGQGYGNCYSTGMARGPRWAGCKWWHFTPQNDEASLKDKYEWLKDYNKPIELD